MPPHFAKLQLDAIWHYLTKTSMARFGLEGRPVSGYFGDWEKSATKKHLTRTVHFGKNFALPTNFDGERLH